MKNIEHRIRNGIWGNISNNVNEKIDKKIHIMLEWAIDDKIKKSMNNIIGSNVFGEINRNLCTF